METRKLMVAAALLSGGQASAQSPLSPLNWPEQERLAAEKAEAAGMSPLESRIHRGSNGAISGTASALSVQAGLEVLKHGGNAADAATAIAMTGITAQAGSVVSFAGVMSLVYYDAKTKKAYSLDGGYRTYAGETDPKSIPAADLGSLGALGGTKSDDKSGAAEPQRGRMTLVPGFMAGFEAMHRRFGQLPWSDLFTPAIHYAENGVPVSPSVAGFFTMRKSFLERTAEGRAFLHPGDRPLPQAGELFYQPETARTLRAVAREGARYMYTGPWAQEFVRLVQRDGGKVTAADLANYQPVWTEPFSTTFAGTTVYAPGGDNFAGYNIIPLLNLAEAMKLDQMPPHWMNAESFVAVSRAARLLEQAPILTPDVQAALDAKGIDRSRAALLTKEFAAKVAPLVDTIGRPAPDDASPKHSHSLVVIDKEGNVAALTHTINTVVWGSAGIVVGGIPIPDSAGFQQERLAMLTPGALVPNEMVQTIVMKEGKPVLATAGIGSGLVPENFKLLLGVIGQKQPLAKVQAAPPLLTTLGITGIGNLPPMHHALVPEGAYDPAFIATAEQSGLKMTVVPVQTANMTRGTIAAVAVDPVSGERQSPDTKGVILFGTAY